MSSYDLTELGVEWINQLIKLNEEACRRFTDLRQNDLFITNTYEYIQTEYFQTGKVIGMINKEMSQDQLIAYSAIVFPGTRQTSMGYDLDFTIDKIKKTAHCESIVVGSGYRGRGRAKSLLAEVKRIAIEANYYYICSSIHPENRPSIISFIQSGYRIIRFKIKHNNKPRYIVCLNLNVEVENPNYNDIQSIDVALEDIIRQKELLSESFVCGKYKLKDNKCFLSFTKSK